MQDVRMALAALKHESDSGQLHKLRLPARQPRRIPPMAIIGLAAALVVLIGGGLGARWLVKRRQANAAQTAAVAVPLTPEPAPATAAPEPPPAPASTPADVALNNDSIIEMVDAKVANSVIISQIRSSPTDFNLSSAEIIRLSKAGVAASVIEAMRNPKAAPAPSTSAKAVPPATAASTKAGIAPSRTPSPPPNAALPAANPSVTAAATPAPPPAPAEAAPSSSPAPRAGAEKLVLVTVTDGSPIRITLAADIAAEAEEGTPLRFVTATDFRAADMVVIAKGASVTGAIVEGAGKKKFLGLGGGKMTFQLMQVDAVDGHKLNIRATSGKRSDGPSVRPVDTGNQKRTKDVAAAAGTAYIGYIEGDQTVSIQR
jgi:hypothetical protein